MKKWVCTVCGYVYEGENPPEKCPQCGVPASKFKEQAADETSWACEHEVGVAQGSPEDIMADLRANFEGECSEVGMYLPHYCPMAVSDTLLSPQAELRQNLSALTHYVYFLKQLLIQK